MLETLDLSELSLDAVRSIYRDVIRYGANLIKARNLKITAKQYGVIDQINKLKKNFLDSNYYMLSEFWRGVWWYSISGNIEESCKKYEVSHDDILLAKEFLLQSDFDELKKINVESHENVTSEKEKLRLLNIVIPYINSIVRRKLSFISKYDSALGTPDLVGELVAEAVRVIHHYDYLNEEKLLNYARRSVHNAAMNIIGSRTTSSRQRVVKTEDANIDNNGISHFRNTIYSLDKIYNVGDANDDDDIKMIDFIRDGNPSQLDIVEQKDVASDVENKLTNSEIKFISIISGEYNKEFEDWISCQNKKTTDSTFSNFVQNVYKFTHVNRMSLKRKLIKSDYFKNTNRSDIVYGRHLRINQPT